MPRDLSRKKQSAGGVNTSGRSVIMDSFMSDVKKKLRQNEYKEVKSSGTSSVWTSFMQIVDKDNKKVSAVKCITITRMCSLTRTACFYGNQSWRDSAIVRVAFFLTCL